jgi:protein involved in polysaccharide export with SLBB domain
MNLKNPDRVPGRCILIRRLVVLVLLATLATQGVAQQVQESSGDTNANTKTSKRQKGSKPGESGSLTDFGLGTSATAAVGVDAGAVDGGQVPNVSADDVIEILQANPNVSADVKAEIAVRMSEQGKPITADQITDDILYQQIRSNPGVKDYVASELLKEGYLSVDQTKIASDQDSGDSSPKYRRPPAAEELSTPKLSQRPSPYKNNPALTDLYSQVPVKGASLKRFGADLFRPGQKPDKLPMDLPVGSDYVVGPGDSLDITLSGGISQTLRRVVDRQGMVPLLEAGLVQVAGHSLAEVQQIAETSLRGQYRNLRAQVSVTRLRTIRVYVVGDVANPGPYDISALSTPLNALLAAGGPNSRGSMRRIRHLRNDQLINEFDSYDLLLHGVKGKLAGLQSGDTILVPTIASQVYVDGMVRRPAIYELKSEKNLGEVLELAGGALNSASFQRIRIERVNPHEGRATLGLNVAASTDADPPNSALQKFNVQDGDRITVYPILGYSDQSVYLQGHVVRPGKQPFSKGMTVGDIISSYQDLMPEPASRGEIVRLKSPDLHPETIFFNVTDVLARRGSPIPLEPFDTIRIYGRYEDDAPKAAIYGEVMRPGEYPMADGMKVTDLLRLAGGFKRSAYTETADLTSYELKNGETIVTDTRTIRIAAALSGEEDVDVRLKPGDVLSIRQLTGWNDIGAAITIEGEVVHPGTYGIEDGERLSSVLRRAGLFRATAYPQGTVLERQQVRELDKKSRALLIRRIESSQPSFKAASGGDQVAFASAFMQQQQQILSRLRSQEPTGRLVIRISSDVSQWENTAGDIEVRSGDHIVVPKRPGFVLLDGQVNNPSAITFVPGKKADWYLSKAGGATEFGNKKKVFVIRADGSVIGRDGSGFWSGGVLDTVMQPGDAIIVPEKIIGPPIWKSLLDAAQIMSAFALTASVLKN